LALFSAAIPNSLVSFFLLLSAGLVLAFSGFLVSIARVIFPPTRIEKYWWLCFPVFWSISFAIEKLKHDNLGRWQSYHHNFLFYPFCIAAYRFERLTGILATLLLTIGLLFITMISPCFAALGIAYHVGLISEYLLLAPETQHGWVISLNVVLNGLPLSLAALEALVALNVTGQMLTPFRRVGSEEPGLIERFGSHPDPVAFLRLIAMMFAIFGQSRILGELPFAWLGIDLISQPVGKCVLLIAVIAIHWCVSKIPPPPIYFTEGR
jgi:hypothetical protein